MIASKKLATLSEILNSKSNNLSFVAVISKIKIYKTKNGEDMAFVVFEDEINSLDGVIFPNLYSSVSLVLGEVYLINGKFDYKKQRQSIIVDSINQLRSKL